MYKIDSKGSVNGQFVDWRSANRPGTELDYNWFNMIYNEFTNILLEAGLENDPSKSDQVLEGVTNIIDTTLRGIKPSTFILDGRLNPNVMGNVVYKPSPEANTIKLINIFVIQDRYNIVINLDNFIGIEDIKINIYNIKLKNTHIHNLKNCQIKIDGSYHAFIDGCNIIQLRERNGKIYNLHNNTDFNLDNLDFRLTKQEKFKRHQNIFSDHSIMRNHSSRDNNDDVYIPELFFEKPDTLPGESTSIQPYYSSIKLPDNRVVFIPIEYGVIVVYDPNVIDSINKMKIYKIPIYELTKNIEYLSNNFIFSHAVYSERYKKIYFYTITQGLYFGDNKQFIIVWDPYNYTFEIVKSSETGEYTIRDGVTIYNEEHNIEFQYLDDGHRKSWYKSHYYRYDPKNEKMKKLYLREKNGTILTDLEGYQYGRSIVYDNETLYTSYGDYSEMNGDYILLLKADLKNNNVEVITSPSHDNKLIGSGVILHKYNDNIYIASDGERSGGNSIVTKYNPATNEFTQIINEHHDIVSYGHGHRGQCDAINDHVIISISGDHVRIIDLESESIKFIDLRYHCAQNTIDVANAFISDDSKLEKIMGACDYIRHVGDNNFVFGGKYGLFHFKLNSDYSIDGHSVHICPTKTNGNTFAYNDGFLNKKGERIEIPRSGFNFLKINKAKNEIETLYVHELFTHPKYEVNGATIDKNGDCYMSPIKQLGRLTRINKDYTFEFIGDNLVFNSVTYRFHGSPIYLKNEGLMLYNSINTDFCDRLVYNIKGNYWFKISGTDSIQERRLSPTGVAMNCVWDIKKSPRRKFCDRLIHLSEMTDLSGVDIDRNSFFPNILSNFQLMGDVTYVYPDIYNVIDIVMFNTFMNEYYKISKTDINNGVVTMCYNHSSFISNGYKLVMDRNKLQMYIVDRMDNILSILQTNEDGFKTNIYLNNMRPNHGYGNLIPNGDSILYTGDVSEFHQARYSTLLVRKHSNKLSYSLFSYFFKPI